MKQGCVATILELAMLALAVALVLGAARGPGFRGTQAGHHVFGKILRSVDL